MSSRRSTKQEATAFSPPTTRRRLSQKRTPGPAAEPESAAEEPAPHTVTPPRTAVAAPEAAASSTTTAPKEDDYHPVAMTGRAVFLSLLAWPVLWAVNKTSLPEHHDQLALFGVFMLGGMAGTAYALFRQYDVYATMFVVFAFTSIIDLILSADINRPPTETGLMSFYLATGEPYLASAYGMAINLWDGTGHYIMYLMMIYGLTSCRPADYRPVYFCWVGSIMYSLVMFLPGAAIGPFSGGAKLSSALNVPYVLIPVGFYVKLQSKYLAPTPVPQVTFPFRLLADVAFGGFCAFAMVIAVLRFMVSLNSESAAAIWWADLEPLLKDENKFFIMYGVVSLLYLAPLYCVFIYLLTFGTSNSTLSRVVTELAYLHAGGTWQAQFSYMMSAWNWRTKQAVQPTHADEFLAINWLLVILPTVFAVYVHYNGFPATRNLAAVQQIQ